MSVPSLRRRLVALAVLFLASLAYVLPAQAQTITVVNEKSLPRLDKDGNTVGKRRLELNPEAVNFQDCLEEQRIKFTLQLAGFVPNARIEVWAANGGVDCAQPANRQSTNQLCWQVAPNVPLQAVVDLTIGVRKIMSGAPPFKATAPVEDPSACGKVDLSTLVVQFLYFKPGENTTPAPKHDVQVIVDTVGPLPPSGLKTKPGNTRIEVSWDNISGEGGVTALTGVRAYCDEATAAGPTTVVTDATTERVCTDAETTEDGATDGGQTCEDVAVDGGTTTTPASECSSPNFVKGEEKVIPDNAFNEKFECGNLTGNSGTTVIARAVGGIPLKNDQNYAIAVAATDAYGNVGELSAVRCEVPEETTDFWESYRAANGQAGGGFCATSSIGAPAGSLGVLGLVVAIAVSSLRRKWKERR